jgi:hypothetical protein
MRNLRTSEIGGGTVRRRFKMGGEWVIPGTTLTAEQLRAMRLQNRNALVETGAIDVWPAQAKLDAGAAAARASEPAEPPRHDPVDGLETWIIPVPGGYDVMRGRRLNIAPMKKVDAKKLATGGGSPATEH